MAEFSPENECRSEAFIGRMLARKMATPWYMNTITAGHESFTAYRQLA